jgi:hypothetical protein
MRRTIPPLIFAIALIVLAGCGAKHITVTVTPPEATLQPGDSAWFSATVSGARNTGVNWSLAEPRAGEVFLGLFNAPKRAGTFHITAASVEDPKAHAIATVTVLPMPVVLDPIMVTLPLDKVKASAPIAFTATAIDESGEHPVSVTWNVREKDGGDITHEGAYTPPLNPGSYHIEAVAKEDPAKKAVALVTVMR